jgi:hypothetical protein
MFLQAGFVDQQDQRSWLVGCRQTGEYPFGPLDLDLFQAFARVRQETLEASFTGVGFGATKAGGGASDFGLLNALCHQKCLGEQSQGGSLWFGQAGKVLVDKGLELR